jgi:hypothetical protein
MMGAGSIFLSTAVRKMSDLSILREGWDSIQKEETRLLRAMTVQESLKQWLQLQQAFEWQLQQTAKFFESERRAALVELQNRLQCLVER